MSLHEYRDFQGNNLSYFLLLTWTKNLALLAVVSTMTCPYHCLVVVVLFGLLFVTTSRLRNLLGSSLRLTHEQAIARNTLASGCTASLLPEDGAVRRTSIMPWKLNRSVATFGKPGKSIRATLRTSTTMMSGLLLYLGVAQNLLLADTSMLATLRAGSIQVPGQCAQ